MVSLLTNSSPCLLHIKLPHLSLNNPTKSYHQAMNHLLRSCLTRQPCWQLARRNFTCRTASFGNELLSKNYSNDRNNKIARFFSSPSRVGPDRKSDDQVFERTVYVHPLSQIILEYFQNYRSDWLIARGLDQALTLHRDGSFVLQIQRSNDDDSPFRIWTSYDEMDKKHWLTVHKGDLHERYLLQDNLMPAWHANRTSLPDRIFLAVDDMIRAIDRVEVLEKGAGAYPK